MRGVPRARRQFERAGIVDFHVEQASAPTDDFCKSSAM